MTRDPFEVAYVSGNQAAHSVSPSATTIVGPSSALSSSRQSTTMTQSFKPGTLYAVLLYRDHSSSSWHWALFLPYETPPPPVLHPHPHASHPTHHATSTNSSESESEVEENDPATTISWKGMVWHCTNDTPQGLWAYEELTPDALGLPRRLVLAARLADLSSLGSPPEVALALSDVLAHVPVRAEAHKSVFNCRTWMLDGIGELDDGGFLSCISTMALERELIAAAQLATPKHEEDGSYVIIIPRNCSDN